ncbi:MAG: hypothetical protein JO189_21395 [Deltaproteobacteria bacterium]|nr:hypothetical protein [Deltaproteobacteria bacterium]
MLRIFARVLRTLNKVPHLALRATLSRLGEGTLAFAVTALCCYATAYAQYNPIPNYGTGGAVISDNPSGAGYYFRHALNAKLSGGDTISPQLVHLNFAALPATVTNGQMFYIDDGASGSPCRGGGHGAIAMGVSGRWACGNIASQVQNVLGYGAQGDCATTDDAAIQAALDATPNNTNDGTTPVYLPATVGISDGLTDKCYLLSKPLVLTHGSINMYGDGREQTFIGANYYGPVLLAGTDTLSLGASLLSGGGNSINLTGTPFLELSMLLRNRLNGQGTFSIEFELSVPASPSNSVILQSAYDWPYQNYARAGLTDVGAVAINYQWINPHLSMTATLSTSGAVTINTANNSMGAGNHAVGFYYDGAHLWGCVDGTATTPVAATGSWVQSKWESITLPDMFGNGAITWPDGAGGAGVTNDSFSGALDNLRISTIARASSGTCPAIPSSKFTYDSATALLLKGLSCADGAQYCLENGTGQYAVYAQSNISPSGTYPTAGNPVWFPVLGQHGSIAPHLYVHDMALGWNWWTQGAYILNASWSQFERLAGLGEHNGFNLYYSDYESTIRETRFMAPNHNGYQAYEFGYVSNTQNAENLTAEQAFVCFNLESAQTGFEEKSGHCLVNGETAIGWLIDYATGTLLDPFLDQEVPDAMLAPIYYRGAAGEGALTLVNGNLDTYGGAPFIVHDAAGAGPIQAIGTLFNNFGEDQPASAIIQFPGYQGWGNLAGTVWQGQSSIALAPHIASAPGTCTGSGGDTNCAKFMIPNVSQFSINAPCTLSGTVWSCANPDSAGTGTVLGVNFYGAHGTFNAGATFANTYSLFTGQLYLLKGTNPIGFFADGGFELSIPGVSPAMDYYVASTNVGNYVIDAIAPSSGFYNFTLSYGHSSCCGTAAGIITPSNVPTNQLPLAVDVLQDVTFADAHIPLSNEVGNAHIEWTGRPPDMDASLTLGPIIGQQERYIP